MTKDIILATDGSETSLQAARYLVDAGLLPDGGTVHVLHVTIALPGRVTRFVDEQTVQQWYAEESAKALDPTVAILHQAGVPHVAKALVGSAPHEIVRYAEEVQPHMIVMGAQGRGALLDAVVGSVASRVLTMVRHPLLLIRRPREQTAPTDQ